MNHEQLTVHKEIIIGELFNFGNYLELKFANYLYKPLPNDLELKLVKKNLEKHVNSIDNYIQLKNNFLIAERERSLSDKQKKTRE